METVGSVLRLYLGKRIQAVTLKGFFAKDNDGDYKLQLAPSLLPCLLRWQLGLHLFGGFHQSCNRFTAIG
ncbi:hypothetical protein M2350_003361 [Candidatus Fervidibacter sacchari]|uniref:Uncharacterized protein n=1 Tax=Candidatus Fervidibacter sacchari TaxID=1448929 RepID=A0ABT2EVH1_9BACT|nr:hypothetical protein [Candidatus Fervidibacter sacchari]